MNELIKKEYLQALDNNALLNEFKNSLSLTVFHLQKMAVIWGILTSRGIDLSEYKKGLIEFVPLIADNKLLPQFVTDFAGQRNLINHVSKIPLDEQEKLLKHGIVQKLSILEDGTELINDLSLHEIRSDELYQIFDKNGLRSIEEQRLLIMKHLPNVKNKKKPKLKSYRKASLDDTGEFLILGNDARIEMSKILDLVSEIYGVEIPMLN